VPINPAADLKRARELLAEIPAIVQQLYASKWELEGDFEIDERRRIRAAAERLAAAQGRLAAIIAEVEGDKDD
jgi:hypothetical protein